MRQMCVIINQNCLCLRRYLGYFLLAFPRCIAGSGAIINHSDPVWFMIASREYSPTNSYYRYQIHHNKNKMADARTT